MEEVAGVTHALYDMLMSDPEVSHRGPLFRTTARDAATGLLC